MLEIGDLFVRKSEYGGRALCTIIAIAEDHEGTKPYSVGREGYYTETQLYDTFDGVTILEEVEEKQCNPNPEA